MTQTNTKRALATNDTPFYCAVTTVRYAKCLSMERSAERQERAGVRLLDVVAAAGHELEVLRGVVQHHAVGAMRRLRKGRQAQRAH